MSDGGGGGGGRIPKALGGRDYQMPTVGRTVEPGPTRPQGPGNQGGGPDQPGSALAIPSREVAELWFSLLRAKWTSLALIPAHPGGTALPLARQLARVGALHRGRAPRVISAEGLGLTEIAQITIDMTQGSRWTMSGNNVGQHDVAENGLVIVALEPIVTNPLGTAIALSADAVLLCIEIGVTTIESARHTIEQIGLERFIGSVVITRE